MKTLHSRREAFTMIELIFAIIVIGILAAVAIPRLDRDFRQEAKDNYIAAIRYTQHLALIDDKTNPFQSGWQANYWTIKFADDGSSYSIVSGSNFAVDPTSGKLYDGQTSGSQSALTGKKYGVKSVKATGGCSGPNIMFDRYGRPFDGTTASGVGIATDYSNYMSADCKLTIEFKSSGIDPLELTISKETGAIKGN